MKANSDTNHGQLYLVAAPSGAGKTSLVHAALESDPQLVVCISHTTRERRRSETDGVNYHFVTQQTFTQMIAEEQFLEYAEVFGQHYGTSKKQVDTLLAEGKDVILEIDWQGAEQVRRLVPDVIGIFILPPSVEVLAERLASRGQDSQKSMEVRLGQAELEMSKAPNFDYILVNDDFDETLADLLCVFRALRLRKDRQIAGNPAIQHILSDS
ncbi:MAG: guanylate kinase [Pseudomonadales bacterium]|jgi:guanylate kinase|nr:guanylate kinase [Pseudomonadales bacterium]